MYRWPMLAIRPWSVFPFENRVGGRGLQAAKKIADFLMVENWRFPNKPEINISKVTGALHKGAR